MANSKSFNIGSFCVEALVGEDGRLKVRISSDDNSKLLVDGISTGKAIETALFSTENVESYLLNKKNF